MKVVHRRIGYFVSSIFLVVALNSCADPKDANEKNFSSAIQKHLDHRWLKGDFCIKVGPFPQTLFIEGYYLKRLESAGLVKKNINDKKFITSITYYLTDSGRKNYQKDRGFCYGMPVIYKINNFTEPSQMYGKTVSEVNYSYRLDHVPKWAFVLGQMRTIGIRDEQVKANINSSEKPILATKTLVLTNKGWAP